jgi:integrase
LRPQVRPRRAFSEHEIRRLLETAGQRKVLYLTAVFTGLRRSELAALERDDVHLEKGKQFLNVRASTTKNHKQAIIALHSDVAGELSLRLAQLPTSERKVFARLMPTMERFKADLQVAKIPFIDAKGLRADFHSLRHTLATNLARAGTAPRVAMEIMRHRDMRLTAKTYTDTGLLPIADAVLKLPSLTGKKSEDSQIDSQNLFREGQDLSSTDTPLLEIPLLDLSANQQVGHENEIPVTTVQENEESGPYRIRI